MRHRVPSNSPAGAALLVAVAMLALLAILALAMFSMTSLEQTTASNYVNLTRSRIVAESGVEQAISRLIELNGTVPHADVQELLRYEAGAAPGLAHAVKSSFSSQGDASIAGSCGGTYLENGDVFKLKVTSEDGKLNLNDTDGRWNIDTDPDADYPDSPDTADQAESHGRLFKLIEHLTIALLAPDNPSSPLGWDVANALLSARASLPNQKFSNLREVEELLVDGGILNQAQFDTLAENITLYSWQDPNTLRPNFHCVIARPNYSGPLAATPPEPYKFDIYLWKEFQTPGFALEPRCPVNVNMASAPLLEALIRPLQGWYLREGPGSCTSFELRGLGWQFRGGEQNRYLPTRFTYCHYDWSLNSADRRRVNLSVPVFQYTPDNTFIPGDKAINRYGQTRRTPNLNDFLNGDFSRLLAQLLHDRIHGNEETGFELPPDPIESWQEMEFALDDLLAQILPDSSSELDVFWQDWMPQPTGYSMAVRWNELRSIIYNQTDQPLFKTQAFGQNFSSSTGIIDRQFWRPYCRRILRDLLLAQFNPNSQLMDFNPDRTQHRFIDKPHLTRYSTELTFQLSGVYRIDAAGIIRDPEGRNAAITEARSIVQLCLPFRITTQAQLYRGYQAPGDFSPGPAELQALAETRTSWNVSALAYPEPLLFVDDGSAPSGEHATVCVADGFIKPAPLEMRGDPFLAGATMACHFDGRLEPSLLDPDVPFAPNPQLEVDDAPGYPSHWTPHVWYGFDNYSGNSWSNVWLMRNNPVAGRLTPPILGTAPLYASLFPDGALSDATRAIGYRATNLGSASGSVGAVQFWFKPNFDPAVTTRIRGLFQLTQTRQNHVNTIGGAPTWVSGIGNFPQVFGLFFFPHYGYSSLEHPSNNAILPPQSVPGGQWAVNDPNCFHCLSTASLAFCGTSIVRRNGFSHPGPPPGGWYILGPPITDNSFAETYVRTPTTVARFPNQIPGQPATHHSYYFESHQWSHAALRWNIRVTGDSVTNDLRLVWNGRDPETDDSPLLRMERAGVKPPANSWEPCYIHAAPEGPNATWARFGGTTSDFGLNYVADGTYDEIIGYQTDTLPSGVLTAFRQTGRYYAPSQPGQEAMYRSPRWDPYAELDLGRRKVRVQSVAWTCTWPRFNERRNLRTGSLEVAALLPSNADQDAIGDGDPAGIIDDPLVSLLGWSDALDPLRVDIARVAPDGTDAWLADSNGDPTDEPEKMLTYTGGTRLPAPMMLEPGDTLRLRVYFNVAPGQVALEAPVLDDITIYLHTGVVWLWQEVLQ